MVRRAMSLAASMSLAVFAFLAMSLVADTARAVEYTPPTTPFTEPALGFSEKPCYHGGFGESTPTERYLNNISGTTKSNCELAYSIGSAQTKRLFWLVNELIKNREQLELLKAEVVKGLGSEGAIAKALAQLHTDLTPTEGLPIRWKSQAVEPEVKFKTAQAVTLASLPELAAGSKAIGTVKVTTLEGEPAIKVGNEPAVKVSSLPELAAGSKAIGSVKVTSLEGEPGVKLNEAPAELVSSVDAAGEATQAALYILAGLVVGLFVGGALWKLVDRGT